MRAYEYFLCQVFHKFRKRLEPPFQCFASVAWAIDVFHGSVVLLCKINIKRQQKLKFFIKKRTAVEPLQNNEEGPEKDGEIKDRMRVR